MTTNTTAQGDTGAVPERPGHALTPYIAVHDARQALEWYADVFAARLEGAPIIMPGGRVGHSELVVGDSLLMVSDEFADIGVLGPRSRGGTTITLHVQVPDVDATVARAVEVGADLERPPKDEPYGRTGVIRDPFGHRWMVQAAAPGAGSPPAEQPEAAPGTGVPSAEQPLAAPGTGSPPAERSVVSPGELAYVTLRTPDDGRAKAFYGAVLGWRFAPGQVPRGWQVEGTSPMSGLWGGADAAAVVPTYAVADVDVAVRTVRDLGGQAEEPTERPYGRTADCVDDQGMAFSVWQP